jgi:hypothetical protein
MAYVSDSDPAAKMAADRAKVGAQLGNGADVLAGTAGPLRDIAAAVAAGTEGTLPGSPAQACRDIAASLREIAGFLDEAAGILP